jgi:hypothetical protein
MPKIERVNTVSAILIHECLPGKDLCKSLLIMELESKYSSSGPVFLNF